MMTHAHTQAKLMDKRPLPIYIEARYLKEDFGKIVAIKERTRCTRNYVIEWANRTTSTVRGAAIRPNWIEHIFKDAQALRLRQVAAKKEKEIQAAIDAEIRRIAKMRREAQVQ